MSDVATLTRTISLPGLNKWQLGVSMDGSSKGQHSLVRPPAEESRGVAFVYEDLGLVLVREVADLASSPIGSHRELPSQTGSCRHLALHNIILRC